MWMEATCYLSQYPPVIHIIVMHIVGHYNVLIDLEKKYKWLWAYKHLLKFTNLKRNSILDYNKISFLKK